MGRTQASEELCNARNNKSRGQRDGPPHRVGAENPLVPLISGSNPLFSETQSQLWRRHAPAHKSGGRACYRARRLGLGEQIRAFFFVSLKGLALMRYFRTTRSCALVALYDNGSAGNLFVFGAAIRQAAHSSFRETKSVLF